MSVYLNVSSSLNRLADAFTQHLSRCGSGIFQPDFIVTQTQGMNNFLRLRLSAQTGISANSRFLKPNELLVEAYRLLAGETQNTVSAHQLRWRIYKILGTDNFSHRFPAIAAYYQSADTDSDLRRLELAEKVADLFDQYQIYRPQLIREWNRKSADPTDWQHYLWGEAVKSGKERLSDKTRMSDAILSALKNPDKVAYLQRKMPVVYVFGLSILTHFHVSLLHELARVIDIHFYLLDPAAGVYWYEDKSEKQVALLQAKGVDTENMQVGNPLLASWGRVVQDTFKLLFRHEAFLNAYEVLETEQRTPATLLQKIQYDIHYSLSGDMRTAIAAEDIADGSLVLNACYTPLREVEGVYNYLVGLYEKGKHFSPQDVLVMVTDITAYAPYIKAVFENAPYRFRYAISDEASQGGDTITDALTAILQLNADTFRPEEVVGLLDYSVMRQRFRLEDTALVRRLTEAANIRFGLNGDPADDTRLVSWRYGLQRIVWGVCMSGEELCQNADDEAFYPLDAVEGSDAETAIRFAYFAEVLMGHLEDRYRARTIADWVTYTERVLNDLVADTGEEVDEELQTILAHFSSFNAAYEYMEDPVSYEVFSRSLLQALRNTRTETNFGYGGITFCSVMPMRSIPFKIVAMLGMDYDKFPRRDGLNSFNKMNEQREVGDRSVRDNDRHLFLETLLSASDNLYLSYIGRRTEDNSSLAPSPLIEELLDYIEEGMGRADRPPKDLLVEHPLHSFSHRYNRENHRLRDFMRLPAGSISQWTDATREETLGEIQEIDAGSLYSFAKNAVAFWYQRRLGIQYEDREAALPDTELFELDNLQKHLLGKRLLSLRKEANADPLRLQMVRTGKLPLSSMSVVVVENARDEIRELQHLIEQAFGEAEPQKIPVEIPLPSNHKITAILEVYEGGRLRYDCLSKNEVHHRTHAVIQYLIGRAAGCVETLYYASKKEEKLYKAKPIDIDEALQYLNEMASLYRLGHDRPLFFSSDIVSKMRIKDDKIPMDSEGFGRFVDHLFKNKAFSQSYLAHHHRQGLCHTQQSHEDFENMYNVFVKITDQILPKK